MDDKPQEHNLNIHLSVSADGVQASQISTSQPDTPAIAQAADISRLYELANLTLVEAYRNTEHGKTLVRNVVFREEEQKKRLLEVLAESFPETLSNLSGLVLVLGMYPNAQVRWQAAAALSILMSEVDFIRFKEKVLIPWATSPDADMNFSASYTLSLLAKDTRYAENVKYLIKHWVSLDDPDLNFTGVVSCGLLYSNWPEDALLFIENAVKRSFPIGLAIVSQQILKEMCEKGYTRQVMEALFRWVTTKGAPTLRLAGCMVFLNITDLECLRREPGVVDKVAELCNLCLGDNSITNSGDLQDAMVEVLKNWAEEAFEKEDLQAILEKLFLRIYARANTDRDRRRVLFYLERWAKQDKRYQPILHALTD